MSKYTTEVRFICEAYAGLDESVGLSGVEDIIQKAIPKVFDFNFPIYDEDYRNVLCTKILKHYYTREICAETVGLWKLWLNDRLNMIMPYYNELYKSAMLDFNPLHDVEITTTHQRTNNGNVDITGNTKETNGNVSRRLYSDTPQGAIDNLENETYLTDATKVTDDGNRTVNRSDNSVSSNTEEYIEKISGKSNGGTSYAKLIMDFRKSVINVDKMIIDELSDLFMGVW